MNSQTKARKTGEQRAQLAMVKWLCAVSVWRTVMTRLLPVFGHSAWWVALLCALPGIAVAVMLRWMMHLTASATLVEGIRACLGRGGAAICSGGLAVMLLQEGLTSLTALVTLFTEGVGTRGTQFTLALLTGAVLMGCLHREGLPRAVLLLRWGMLAAAAVLVFFMLGDVQLDHLFPLQAGNCLNAPMIGRYIGLSWPLILLLTLAPQDSSGRLRQGIIPVFAAIGFVLLTLLTLPKTWLQEQQSMSDWLLLPVWFMPNVVRVLGLCLLMLALFGSIGFTVQLAVQQLEGCAVHLPRWLPYGLLAAMIATQATNTKRLWTLLSQLEPWLFLSILLVAVCSLVIALYRRKEE